MGLRPAKGDESTWGRLATCGPIANRSRRAVLACHMPRNDFQRSGLLMK